MSEPYDGGPDQRRRAEAARLREELRALGRSLDGPDPAAGAETMAERVLGRILAENLQVAEEPSRPERARERLRAVRRWSRLHRRRLVAALCGLLTVLALTPPVRAAVADWFGFGGVEVRHDPSAVPPSDAPVPGCGSPTVSLAEARRRAGFEPMVPKGLGSPDAVTVHRLPYGRFLVSLCWSERGRTIRLDEFPAQLDFTFAKTVREQPVWLSLDGDGPDGEDGDGPFRPALWFARPHALEFWLVDPDGRRFTREERTAGPTLLWTHGGGAFDPGAAGPETVTLRLEGVAAQGRALEIARSVESVESVRR
ncbi:hypothetical protein GCM10009601_14420 [Streptomyces thermospinosisporus]|uniref:DUF4179 domain-containing protein n=1 Tax=Streptomyces thermospinosisporus TaxID=161482 RepID=A0ABN1YNE5_9ACTN